MRAMCPDCKRLASVSGGRFAYHTNPVDLSVCAGVDKLANGHADAKKAPAKKAAPVKKSAPAKKATAKKG
jgi:hypothetical protein